MDDDDGGRPMLKSSNDSSSSSTSSLSLYRVTRDVDNLLLHTTTYIVYSDI